MAVPREDWLILTPETAIEPEMPVVDPHHHFWKHAGDNYLLPELIRDRAAFFERALSALF